jgi:hypothetical protein
VAVVERRFRFPCWIVSVLIAAPVLVSVSLPPEPVVVGQVGFSPYGCVPRPWSTLTLSEKAEQRIAPLLKRRHFRFAPSRPPFPPVI